VQDNLVCGLEQRKRNCRPYVSSSSNSTTDMGSSTRERSDRYGEEKHGVRCAPVNMAREYQVAANASFELSEPRPKKINRQSDDLSEVEACDLPILHGHRDKNVVSRVLKF
jgi:hypothetical protein